MGRYGLGVIPQTARCPKIVALNLRVRLCAAPTNSHLSCLSSLTRFPAISKIRNLASRGHLRDSGDQKGRAPSGQHASGPRQASRWQNARADRPQRREYLNPLCLLSSVIQPIERSSRLPAISAALSKRRMKSFRTESGSIRCGNRLAD